MSLLELPGVGPGIRRVGLVVALVGLALVIGACSQEQEPEQTASIDECAHNLYASFNPKIYDQCVDVCKRCQRGITTTCTTSCTLKGAR